MKRPALLLILLFITGCASLIYTAPDYQTLYGASAPKQRILTPEQVILAQQPHKISFTHDVKPILDSRCVACHGCYDAPCQLKLGSMDGIDRGATKQLVYDSARLSPAKPTRLFIDADNTTEWRTKNFYPVLNERTDSPTANLDNSVLAKLLDLKRTHPQPATGKLSDDYDLTMDRELQCPTVDEFPKYQHEHPQWGMPYALPALSLQEDNIIKQWLQEGAKVEPLPPLSSHAMTEIEKWEQYFNGSTLKQKLVFRYIYEHLFIGHIHFQGHPHNEFFQWVRSTTPTGQPINIINSRRPYDDPQGVFYYRLRPVTETIVDKTHFVYELSDAKKQRYDELFFKPDYQVTTLPAYQPAVAANPFTAFAALPMVSRYQFMLDDAHYIVSGFIKGPVCRGDIATNSIRDQFWVVFTQPGGFYPEKMAKALENNPLLGLPGEEANDIGLLGWTKFDTFGREYLKAKDDFINALLPKNHGVGLANIWNGDGHNQNAALTIFRHFDSATVVKGLVGDTPLTGWVIDYPTLERLHYLLVAGFDIYGTAGHQIASRTYMDILRQDAEDNFLRFMPAAQRKNIYNSWYVGSDSLRIAAPLFSIDHPSEINYQTTAYKREFFDQIRQHLGNAAGETDSINRCPQNTCVRANTTPAQQQADRTLRTLAQVKGGQLGALPEMSLLRIKTGKPEGDLVYTLVLNKNYSNISNMLAERSHRVPQNDSITIVSGFIGSYPNFFFAVEQNQLTEFVALIKNARTETDMDAVYNRFGVRRTNPEIWQHADWFNQQHPKYRGLEAGLFDMNRYKNL